MPEYGDISLFDDLQTHQLCSKACGINFKHSKIAVTCNMKKDHVTIYSLYHTPFPNSCTRAHAKAHVRLNNFGWDSSVVLTGVVVRSTKNKYSTSTPCLGLPAFHFTCWARPHSSIQPLNIGTILQPLNYTHHSYTVMWYMHIHIHICTVTLHLILLDPLQSYIFYIQLAYHGLS